MRTITVLIVACLGLALRAQAARYDFGFADQGFVPDSPGTGSDTRALSGLSPGVESASGTVDLSGGCNRDLCVRLGYCGSQLVLLNGQGVGPGFGPASAWGYSAAASSRAVAPVGYPAGDIHINRGAEAPARTCAAEEGNVRPEDLSAVDAPGLSGAGQPARSSQFGGLEPLHLALVGLVVGAACVGLGLRLYARTRVERVLVTRRISF